ncbi:hypothetical protein [Actinomyces israelii]|uniref:hypothetical protein n=1 Tax=Actinomyces israelii TaxID=1659 RepID=UPI002357E07C|nr:hypothetical protein [Actinomyces israelii]
MTPPTGGSACPGRTVHSSPDDTPGRPPPQARQTREDERPRPTPHKALTAASGICLSVWTGLTLVPIIARLMPLPGARFVALLGGDLPGRERDFFFSGLGILLSGTIILVMQLWIRRDTHTMSSVGTAELGINLLGLLALACPILTLVKLYPAYSPGAHLLITGSILIAASIVLLPPRPLAWPPPDDDGRGPLRRLARALRSPRFWIRAAAAIGVVILTITSAQVYCALAPPTRAFSASLSHPSGSGPDLTAHTSDSGAWATEFKHSQFGYIVTAAGPIVLSVPEKDEKDEKDKGQQEERDTGIRTRPAHHPGHHPARPGRWRPAPRTGAWSSPISSGDPPITRGAHPFPTRTIPPAGARSPILTGHCWPSTSTPPGTNPPTSGSPPLPSST